MTGASLYEDVTKRSDTTVIEEHFLKGFCKLSNVMDIVCIEKQESGAINKRFIACATNKNIMQAWADWFRKKEVPFIIVEYEKCIKLWKERMVND